MYKLLLTTAVLLCICLFTQAQTTAQPATFEQGVYPTEAILKAKDMASFMQLSAEKQDALATFFKKESEAVISAQLNHLTSKQVLDLKVQLKAEFQSLLSAQELALYSQQRPASEYAKLTPVAGH
jgi:hypothetical protein